MITPVRSGSRARRAPGPPSSSICRRRPSRRTWRRDVDLSTAPVVETFGRYRLHRKIGEGGMAEVFLASNMDQPPNSPPLVIKRLHQRLERDREAVDLFLTEADVTMMLQHPNVIR